MESLKSAEQCRERANALIREAVPEEDPGRRQALLAMADHWSELMRLRASRDMAVAARGN